MEFNQLEYVTEVADTGSFSQAASNLFYSQPALTQQIIKLEKELGVQLFHRAHGSVTLTEAGEAFVEYAHIILNAKKKALDIMDDYAQNRTGSLTVLLPNERGAEIMSGIYPDFHNKFPGIVMNAIQTSVHRQIERISKGSADLGFVLLADESDLKGLDYHRLATEQFLFAVSRSNPLCRDAASGDTPTEALPVCTPEMLASAQYAMNQPFTTSNNLIMHYLVARGITPSIVLYTNTNISTLEFIRDGIACCILSEWYRANDDDIAYYRLPDGLTWSMYAIWKKGHYRTNASHLTENLITAYLQSRSRGAEDM